MKYEPKSANDIAALRLKPEGEYPFDVATAVDTQSKSSGKDMLAIVLNCYDAEGNVFTVNDYLVPGTAYGDKKVFEFAATIGLSAKYASGEFTAEDCLGKGGTVKIKIGKAQPKDKANPSGDCWAPKNEVSWYVSKPSQSAPSAQPHRQSTPPPPPLSGGGTDEEVPFDSAA